MELLVSHLCDGIVDSASHGVALGVFDYSWR
jgi:hypothetical protein